MGNDSFTTRVLNRADDAWSAAIRDLDSSGTPVALPSRREWVGHLGSGSPVLIAAHDRRGRCHAVLSLDIAPTRALPGHVLARGQRLGACLVGDAGDAIFARLRQFSIEYPRLLQVNLEFILRTSEEHARVGEALRRLGFQHTIAPRNYLETLVIDLTGDEEALFGSFSATTRSELRNWSQHAVERRLIREPRYAPRLDEIAHETLARTNGEYVPRDWVQRIALCEQLPAKSRLVGLFRAGRDDPDALLSYAWGCAHGDHAHYDDAGSTRVDDIKVPMTSPLLWDLIQWAKRGRCRWFDMGGTLPEPASNDDPRAGIDRFKRRFSKEVTKVGAEWVLVPRPGRARLAASLRNIGSNLPGHRDLPKKFSR